MSKKKGSFVDQYLDKIILGAVGLIGLVLLWFYVISGPYSHSVGSTRYSPSEIDEQNRQAAEQIREKLDGGAQRKLYALNRATEYDKILNCSISPQVPLVAQIPLPSKGLDVAGTEDRLYTMPALPVVANAQGGVVRNVVRKPTQDVTMEMPYAMTAYEPADMDIVSISATIDVQALYQNFQKSFMGPRLKPQWKDPVLAEPVFARVELQRRVQMEDGSWGDWQAVPQAKILTYRALQDRLPATNEESDSTVAGRFVGQFRSEDIQIEILQPICYDFLTASTIKWLPPEYQKQYDELIKKQQMEERRRRQEERARMANPRGAMATPQPPTTPTRPSRTTRRGGAGGDTGMIDPMMGGMAMPSPVAPVKQEKKPEDIAKEADKVKLVKPLKISTIRDPLLVWAHDDTAAPGYTYEYRIRYGVFNPIVGKNWFAPDSKAFQNQVVLWSDFASAADVIEIPKMLHVFPQKKLADGVTVEICKYYLGQWRSQEFTIRPGQLIGKEMEWKPSPAEAALGGEMGMMDPMMVDPMMMGTGGAPAGPTMVNYSTFWTLVDVVDSVDWLYPAMRKRDYPRMIYVDKAGQVQILPAARAGWTRQMSKDYLAVQEAMKKPIDTLNMMNLEMMDPAMMEMLPGG